LLTCFFHALNNVKSFKISVTLPENFKKTRLYSIDFLVFP
jgi:hypothetical protein